MPASSSPGLSLSTLIQYTVIGLVVYILAGAPQLPILSFSSSSSARSPQGWGKQSAGGTKDGKAARFQGDKIENLIHPRRDLECKELEHGYKTHVFSREPLVVYIEGFLSEGERRRVVELR